MKDVGKDTALPREKLLQLLKDCSDVFRFVSSKTKILAALSWPESITEEFLGKGASILPAPTYQIDNDGLSKAAESLSTLKPKIEGNHPVLEWLRRTYDSFESGIRLLQNVEKPEFFRISSELYGSSSSPAGRGKTTMLDLSRGVCARMVACSSRT